MSTEPSVRIVGRNPESALVIVGGIRVRVRYRRNRGPWTACDEHGAFYDGEHCEHTHGALDALDKEGTTK